jgi:HlyD family secretion protein
LTFKTKFKDVFTKGVVKKVVLGLICIAAVIGILQIKPIHDKLFGSKTQVKQNTATVKKGDIQTLVSGSGSIYFKNDSKLYSKVNGTVTAVNFKEGDKVKKGDVIYELDSTDAESSIENNQNNLTQNEISAESSSESVNNLTIRAPFSGQVSNITVGIGDSLQNNGTILTITDTSKLKVVLTYNAGDIGKIRSGQTAEVYISSLMQSVKGTVTYVSSEPSASASGAKLYTVEVQLSNPGASLDGMTASAEISTSKGTVSSTNSAALSYIAKRAVVSKTGGTVSALYVKENQKVTSGQVLAVMDNADVIRAKETSDLKLQSAQSQIASSQKQLNNYKIVAPFDGVITKLSNKVGDTVTPGTEVAEVSDPTVMEFDIPVDELDIAKISVGQKVNITADALTETSAAPIAGEVEKIAVQGTAVSGVTTFPVTIKIDDNLDKLKGGMNANANIIVSNKENVLYVPIEAVTTINGKSFVRIKGTENSGNAGSFAYGNRSGNSSSKSSTSSSRKNSSSNNQFGGEPGGEQGETSSNTNEATVSTNFSSSQKRSGSFSRSSSGSKTQSYYAGTVMKAVQVGVNNDTYIEITSGLNEGDVVILPATQAASSSSSSSSNSLRMGGMGGFGGGR